LSFGVLMTVGARRSERSNVVGLRRNILIIRIRSRFGGGHLVAVLVDQAPENLA
jgi:hypothetical protein